jgi:hypothetical protein
MTKIAGSESGSGSISQRHGSADPDRLHTKMSWMRNTDFFGFMSHFRALRNPPLRRTISSTTRTRRSRWTIRMPTPPGSSRIPTRTTSKSVGTLFRKTFLIFHQYNFWRALIHGTNEKSDFDGEISSYYICFLCVL